MSRWDEHPVLPREAEDLGAHVEACSKRYNALQRLQYEISKKLRAMQVEGWFWRGLLFPLLCFVAWELWKLNDKLF